MITLWVQKQYKRQFTIYYKDIGNYIGKTIEKFTKEQLSDKQNGKDSWRRPSLDLFSQFDWLVLSEAQNETLLCLPSLVCNIQRERCFTEETGLETVEGLQAFPRQGWILNYSF